MADDKLNRLIIAHEGREERVYLDSLGNLTCGIGHLLAEGSPVPPGAVDAFFEMDMINARQCYDGLKLSLDPVREAALISMCFNMGYRINQFQRMIGHLRREEYATAADEALNSRWKNQVKGRAFELARMIETGEWPSWV